MDTTTEPTTGNGNGTRKVIDTKLQVKYQYVEQPGYTESKLNDLISFLSEQCKGVKQ